VVNIQSAPTTNSELVRIDVQMLDEPNRSVTVRCKNPEAVLGQLRIALESISEENENNNCSETTIDKTNFAIKLWILLGQIDNTETKRLNAIEDLTMLHRNDPETLKARIEYISRTKRVLPSWQSQSLRPHHESEEENFGNLVCQQQIDQKDLKTFLIDAANKEQKSLWARTVCDAILMGHQVQKNIRW
jgi:hypothetical protein